ncbi:MAG: zinc ABC transporter substrate-binding protein [Campylobacterales bacterium]|nr:zinc ABC transporter substrate-binding protein [Campylobacterales bacterium]
MKNILTINILIGFVLTSFAFGNVNAVVSILPQKTFLKKIGGDKVNITLMVEPGQSPATYEPKASQMKSLSNADIYFAIGVPFEHVWLDKIQSQNKSMKVVSTQKDKAMDRIKKPKRAHSHKKKKMKKHEDSHLDLHIWVSPKRVKVIGKVMADSLIKIDPKNKHYYEKNLEKFTQEIEQTDKKIQKILKNTPIGTKFMVFHPAWGYFAHDYGLTQIAIEKAGKEPKPKELTRLIAVAKKENVKTILTQPEFSQKGAKLIAKEIGGSVVGISPLHPKWSKNLIKMAKTIAK